MDVTLTASETAHVTAIALEGNSIEAINIYSYPNNYLVPIILSIDCAYRQ
jgi:hypothetical protein